MPKRYDIDTVDRDENGAIRGITTTGGTHKTVEEVVKDLNNGYKVNNGNTPVIPVDDRYIRTIPNGKENDNLENK